MSRGRSRPRAGRWQKSETQGTAFRPSPTFPFSTLQVDRCVEAHSQKRPGGQVDVLSFGSRDRTAAADEDAGHGALHAAEDRAEDRAGARADADLLLLALDAFALQRLRHRGAD